MNWNCTETDAEGHCTKCDDGTTLSSELLCEENKECSNISNDTCTKYIEGYSLNEYKICKEDFNCSVFDENSQCIECEEGSTFNSNTNKCEYNPYCLEVNSSSRLCTKCSEGYTLSTAWYHYYECIKDDKCTKVNETGFCIKCVEHYTVSDEHICEEDYDCNLIDIFGKCIECNCPIGMNGGICTPDDTDNLSGISHFLEGLIIFITALLCIIATIVMAAITGVVIVKNKN